LGPLLQTAVGLADSFIGKKGWCFIFSQ